MRTINTIISFSTIITLSVFWSLPDHRKLVHARGPVCANAYVTVSRKGDDTVGNPHRAQIDGFELFELINY